MKIAILTSNSLRHHYFVNMVAAEHEVVGVVTAVKRDLVLESKGDEPTVMAKHLRARGEAEQRYFAEHPEARCDSVMTVGVGEANLPAVYQFLQRLDPEVVLLFGTNIIRPPILTHFEGERHDADSFVSKIFAENVDNEAAWCERTYMRPEHIRALASRGYLGSHSFDHLPLAILETDAMREQLRRNQVELEKMGGRFVPYVSFPYGGANAVSEREAVVCAELGLKVGFTMERSLNASLGHPLMFARIDTNDGLGGSRPLMALRDGSLALDGGISPARRRYFSEAEV